MGDAVLGFSGSGALVTTTRGVFMAAGNGVVVCRNTESFFWQPTSGQYAIHCLDACSSTGELCLTERRRAVSLYIFAVADLRMLQEVPNVAAVEVASVRFAHAGACLFVLCNIPASSVQVMQRSRDGYVATQCIQLPETCTWSMPHDAHFALDTHDLVVLGDNQLRGYTCQHTGAYAMCMHMACDDDDDALVCVAVSQSGAVLVGTHSGNLLLCDAHTQGSRCVARVPDEGGVTALLCDDRASTCVFATAAGRVYALPLHDNTDASPHALCSVGSCVHRILAVPRCTSATDVDSKNSGSAHDVEYVVAAADGVYVCAVRDDDNVGVVTTLRRRTGSVARCLALCDDAASVLVCDNGSLAVYAAESVVYWQRDAPLSVLDACLVDDKHVALVCRDGVLRCCDVRAGRDVWNGCFTGFRPRLCASDGHGMLVCCDDACVRFFVARGGNLVSRGLLHANVTSPVTVMRWVVDALFLVACGNGELFLLTMPPPCDPDAQHAVEDVACGMWRLDFPVVDALPCFVSDDAIHLLVHSMDKDTKLYAIERRRDAETRALRPLFLMHDHEGGGTCITHVHGSTVLSAGKDGRLILRDVAHYQCRLSALPPSKEKRRPLRSALVHCAADGGVRTVCAVAYDRDARTTTAVVAGRDDAVVVRVRMLAECSDTTTATATASGAASTLTATSRSGAACAFTSTRWCWREPQWRVAALQCHVADAVVECNSDGADAAVQRARVVATMRQLRDAWTRVMAGCDVDVPVEELLLPGRRALFDAECDAAVATMRTDVRYHELYNAYVQDVIRRHCCDVMDVPRSRIGALCTRDLRVSNFAVRKEARAVVGLVYKVSLLRRMQMRVRVDARQTPTAVRTDTTRTVAAARAHGAATASTPATATTEVRSGNGDGGDEHVRTNDEDEDDNDDGDACNAFRRLLRPCTEVYTEARSAVQMTLLHGLVVALRDRYNARYDDVREWRRHVVSEIRERNRRCVKIAKQLGGAPSDYFTLREQDDKDAGGDGNTQTLFSANDDDLPAELRALAAHDADAHRAHSDTSVYAVADEAALRLWMDGLEKDVQVLRVTVQPPDFLDETHEAYVPPDERSDAQVQQVDAYEKQLAEETAAVAVAKAALRDEFATLQRVNAQAAHAVDDALLRLRRARVAVCERVHAAELQLLATLQHRLAVHDIRQRYRDVAHRRENVQTRHCAALTHVHNQLATAAQAHAVYDALQSHNANWLDALRAVSPFVDSPHGDKLYRRLVRWKHRLDEGNTVARPQRDAPADDMSADAWVSFCDHCDAAVQLRDRLDAALAHAQRHDSLLDAARRQCEAAAVCVADMDDEMQQLRASCVRTLLDTPVLYRLGQGQLQDERAVIGSELAGMCMRWRSDVKQYNKLVVASHGDSSTLLQRAAQRQQRVKLLQWQCDRLEYEAATLAMELRQLHTLRVTRDMHEWLNGAAAVTEEAAMQKVARHVALVNARMQRKVTQLRSAAAQLRAQIAERAAENAALSRQWQQLRGAVDDATAVKSVLDAHASEAAQHAHRVCELRTTSRLEQLARQQQEELLRLKAVVDRLRERTFPSFAVVSKQTM